MDEAFIGTIKIDSFRIDLCGYVRGAFRAKPTGDYENVIHVSYDGQPLSPGADDA